MIFGSTTDRRRTYSALLRRSTRLPDRAINELVTMVTSGVTVNGVASGANPERALQYETTAVSPSNLKIKCGRSQAPNMLSDT